MDEMTSTGLSDHLSPSWRLWEWPLDATLAYSPPGNFTVQITETRNGVHLLYSKLNFIDKVFFFHIQIVSDKHLFLLMLENKINFQSSILKTNMITFLNALFKQAPMYSET